LPELLLRIHYDRAIPSDGFLERLSRDEQKSDSIIPGLNSNFVTPVK
jgi:hypothetical protein